MSQRIFTFPSTYEAVLETLLQELGFSLSEPRRLADAIRRLSDHYLNNPDAKSPWQEAWAQAASLAYYFPLNRARAAAIAFEAERLGFWRDSQLSHLVDFGSGMGSALHAFADHFVLGSSSAPSLIALDISAKSLELNRRLCPPGREITAQTLTSQWNEEPSNLPKKGTFALLASYVLTELPSLPSWWKDAQALIIIEPSTQADGRRLMEARKELIDSGYHIWAPCTHQGPCPLLEQSAKDWCHDRIHFDAPKWFQEIEKHLPMKNRTLTFSYLLASKNRPAPAQLLGLARIVGDTLLEKGKSRQAICRGSEREFLAWFPPRIEKAGETLPEINRGELVSLASDVEKKSNEIRLKSANQLSLVSGVLD
jgi:hypothetical protein